MQGRARHQRDTCSSQSEKCDYTQSVKTRSSASPHEHELNRNNDLMGYHMMKQRHGVALGRSETDDNLPAYHFLHFRDHSLALSGTGMGHGEPVPPAALYARRDAWLLYLYCRL